MILLSFVSLVSFDGISKGVNPNHPLTRLVFRLKKGGKNSEKGRKKGVKNLKKEKKVGEKGNEKGRINAGFSGQKGGVLALYER
jgi:hypothetical protein